MSVEGKAAWSEGDGEPWVRVKDVHFPVSLLCLADRIRAMRTDCGPSKLRNRKYQTH